MNNFSIEDINYYKLDMPQDIPHFKLENGEKIFRSAFEFAMNHINRKLNWKEGYDDIGKWIEDNQNKGILILGKCSTGKTFITRYVIPIIFSKYHHRVIKSHDIQREKIENIINKKIIILDDIGTEVIKNEYGTKREVFSEIVDVAEKNGNLLILNTNLTGEEIKERYGTRIYERLLAITKRVIVKGESERNK